MVNRISLVLSLACFGTLAAGLVIEVVTGEVLFETYISGFSSWGVILGMIYEWTKVRGERLPDLGLR